MLDIQKMLKNIDVERTVKQGVALAKDNLPTIFAASALGCLVLGMYETAVATHKSDKDIEEEEYRRTVELPAYENTELTPKEKFELCWRNYIKAALYGGASAFFIIASERKGHEKYLALMSAYELTRKAGEERKEAEVDILGQDKASEIENRVRQRMAQSISVPGDDDIQVVTGNSQKALYVEPYTNTPFWATTEDVLHAFNYVNYKKNSEGAASINDFLEDLGLRTQVIAQDYGWNQDQPMVEPELDNTTHVDDDPSKPATLIYYSVEPSYDYGNDRRQW